MTIGSAIIASVANIVSTSVPQGVDTDAPGQFVEWGNADLASAMARSFEVTVVGGDLYGDTGLDAKTAYRWGYMRFQISVKYVDINANARRIDSVIMDDVQGLQDRVTRQLTQNSGVAGCGACVTDGEFSINHGINGDPSQVIVDIPFRVEYQDTQVTT